jgi:hypothetical protein
MHNIDLLSSVAIRPNLELKTQPKQLLGPLPLDIALRIANMALVEVDFFEN